MMILLRGARQLLTLRGPSPRRGLQLSDLGIIPDGAVLIDGETIDSVGPTRRIENLAKARSAEVIDAAGKVILPGFVDCHTRLVFSPPLAHESAAKTPVVSHGLGYRGPALPVAPPPVIRKTSAKVLILRARRWVQLFAAHGTTTLETRSGCGLSLPMELKGLRVARALNESPLEVICTFLAGCPESLDRPGSRRAAAVEQITEVLLPAIERRRLASFCDVECGPGAFRLEQARTILEAARNRGLGLRVQAERTKYAGAAGLAVELEAASAEHLQFIRPEDIDALAGSSTIATLLPAVGCPGGGGRVAPARELVDRGAAIALATGFGPHSRPTVSMPTVLSLACTQIGLTPEEAVSAATMNGAVAVGRADRIGSLEPGKQADLAMFDVGDYREIPYYFGVNLCVMTIKKGKVIYRQPRLSPAPIEPPGLKGRQDSRPSGSGAVPPQDSRRPAR